MKYFKKIEGDRVYLSPVNPEDAEKYTKWVNDTVVAIRLGNASDVFSLNKERGFLESLANDGHNYAIVLKDTDELIGNCSLFSINQVFRTAEVGLFIGEESERSKGYGSEALKLLLEYGFKILNLNNIMLKVFEFNRGAIKCYEKVGFRVIGKRSESCLIDGTYYDEVFMEALAKNFQSQYLNRYLPKKD